MKRMYIASLLTLLVSWNPQLYVNAADTSIVVLNCYESACTVRDRLRKEIRRNGNLSKDARNVEVTGGNGCLILRGVVDSEKEKATINDLAHKCCHSQIVNELEVKEVSTDLLPYAQINHSIIR